MHTYLIEPLAPLVFRSGKPFAGQTGADGGNFPLPSSAAGLLRTVAADQKTQAFSDDLKQQAARGPLLARYQTVNQLTVLVPKPADALYLKGTDGKTSIVRLLPQAFAGDSGSDLPEGLLPVQMQENLKGKPVSGPSHWALADLLAWQQGKVFTLDEVKKNGLDTLPTEQRTHVALDDSSLASDDGRLFQTAGLDLQPLKNKEKNTWDDTRLGFITQTSADLKNELVTFGGERRLSRLEKLTGNNWTLTNTQLSAQVRQAKGLRLTLITPAVFSQGYLPGWLDGKTLEGCMPGCPQLRLKLKAVAIDRWLPVSGWDLAQWKPKAMRKAVAAGAVYWFEVIGDVPDKLHESLWLAPVSDDEQDQRDGFGLALPAAWQTV